MELLELDMWIRDNFVYNRIDKMENSKESIIGIKIGYPKQRRFNIIGWYRQWSFIFNNKKYEKLSFPTMNERFESQLKNIVPYTDIETIIVGDLNIDYRIINKNEEDKNGYEKNFNPMINSLQQHLLGNNFTQLITSDTRQNKMFIMSTVTM